MEIKLPKIPIKKEEIKQRNKAMLTYDTDKGGILAKVLAFIKIEEPASNDTIKEALQSYYKIEFDISRIKTATKRLYGLSMLNSITSGELMTMPPNEHTEIHKEAYQKFFRYLEHIPKQFRRNYDKLTYYWLNNSEGLEYVEWACKLLGFEVTK